MPPNSPCSTTARAFETCYLRAPCPPCGKFAKKRYAPCDQTLKNSGWELLALPPEMAGPMLRRLWYDHMIGTGLERALLVRRRSPYWRRAGIVFIHVPKAAGTTLSEALYGRFLGHVRAADVRRWGPQSLKSLPLVAVTRNPWDRLVSAYRFAKRGTGIGGRKPGAVWRSAQYAVPEFETFERFVTEWLARRNPRDLDYVFQPQCQFVCDDNGDVVVDHLGRFENLAETCAFLWPDTSDAPNTAKANRSGEVVDYRGLYTPELAELVQSIYQEDVVSFGYSFD